MFCGLRNFHWLCISMGVRRWLLNTHFWVNLSFDKTERQKNIYCTFPLKHDHLPSEVVCVDISNRVLTIKTSHLNASEHIIFSFLILTITLSVETDFSCAAERRQSRNVYDKSVTFNHLLNVKPVVVYRYIFSSLYKCQLMQSTRFGTCDLY